MDEAGNGRASRAAVGSHVRFVVHGTRLLHANKLLLFLEKLKEKLYTARGKSMPLGITTSEELLLLGLLKAAAGLKQPDEANTC